MAAPDCLLVYLIICSNLLGVVNIFVLTGRWQAFASTNSCEAAPAKYDTIYTVPIKKGIHLRLVTFLMYCYTTLNQRCNEVY